MRNTIIEAIKKAFDENKRVFYREQDIQIFLIEYFNKMEIFNNVFFEYHIKTDFLDSYQWEKDKNLYIDIVLQKNEKFYPIEIKYKTIKQEFITNIFGQKGIKMATEFQGAINLGCYDLWKDVKRLEIIQKKFKNVQQGIILFVTNDKSYVENPKNDQTGYYQFSIAENKQVFENQTLDWNKDLKIAENRGAITFDNSYTINWNELNCENWEKTKKNIKHFYFIL
jgi:hypothetical protein